MDNVIAELKRLNTDASYAKTECVRIALNKMRKHKHTVWSVSNGTFTCRWFREDGSECGGSGSNWLSNCFGSLHSKWKEGISATPEQFEGYLRIKADYKREWVRYSLYRPKCGVEVVGMRPFAKGTTYSNQCRLTVAKLKELCKQNGLKVKGDKVALLSALMKC